MADIIVRTERLILRTWDDSDSDRFYAAMNTPAVMRYLGGDQDRATWDAAKQRLDGYQRDFGHTFWIVEQASDGELLGFCGLKRVNAEGAGSITGAHEIGWRLRESAWGRGFAKEAATASLDLAFGRLAAPFVVALTVEQNAASWGLMRRLGMTRRADLDFYEPKYGPELNPTIVYRIAADEWRAAG